MGQDQATRPAFKEAGDAVRYNKGSVNLADIARMLHASALAHLGPGRVYELRERPETPHAPFSSGRAWYWCEKFDGPGFDPAPPDGYVLIGRFITSLDLARGVR